MMKITDKKCPVCGCDSFIVNEHYNYSIDHKIKNGVMNPKYFKNDDYKIDYIHAVCEKCGHEWNMKHSDSWAKYKSVPEHMKYNGNYYSIRRNIIKITNKTRGFVMKYVRDDDINKEIFVVYGADWEDAEFKMLQNLKKYKI